MFPARVSVATFNIWGNNLWPDRALGLTQTLTALRSDVYLFQEVSPDIIEHLDATMTNYSRVHDKKIGWLTEGNIYWNSSLLECVDYGASDLGLVGLENRCLFWVRLAIKGTEIKFFVSTAHFPWVGSQHEIETGVNQRIVAATKVCELIRKLVLPQEITIFAGDLNEDFHPVRILSEEMGMMDVFESLDLPPPITHPVRPSSAMEEMRPNRTLDWILCSLPSQCRVVAAFAKGVRGGTHVPVSDHLPVLAVFELQV
jgi:endonuclease/exonuclease/phosphatase family metal-dependent hydrolase